MRCVAQDQSLGAIGTFEVTDPLNAIKQTMEWRHLSWSAQPLHAQIFQVHISEFPRHGVWDITIHAMYEDNRQTYVLTVQC